MAVLGIPVLEDKYPVSMDMWPIQCKEFNRVWQFYENLKQGKLTTTKCKGCGKVSYPPRVICPECYSEDLEYVELPKKAKIVVFSEELKGVPLGYDSPLIHATIEFPPGSPIKGLVTKIVNCPAGKLKDGDEVQLVIFPVPPHPMDVKGGVAMKERVFFAFEPVNK